MNAFFHILVSYNKFWSGIKVVQCKMLLCRYDWPKNIFSKFYLVLMYLVNYLVCFITITYIVIAILMLLFVNAILNLL